MEKQYKIIFKPSLARKLLKDGNYVVDIKKSRDNENATVFVFENTEKFREDLSRILADHAEEQQD